MTLGQVLKGRYRIAERIGSGGMSTVYLAHVVDTGQSVAVKVVNEALAFDEQYARRFAQELAIARLLDHPGIPRLIDDGQTEEGVPFLVLEYVQGITLTEYLRKKGPLPIEEAVAIASSVLTILSYAYSKGIQAHRDIKPGNIMIDLRTHAVTVMDFGIAKTVGSSLTHSTVLYTPRYAAPEQLLPSKFGGVVDKRADLYALGVVLYEMLTGRVPFTGETPAEISGEQITSPPPSPSSIRRDIPAPLSQVLLTCLQANPSHRYQTPQDLLQDLREGRPSPTRETTETLIRKEPPVVPVDQPRPRPRLPLLVPLLALALVILIPLTIMLVRGAKSEPPVAVTATLTVTSTPPGAQVSLNGTSSGTTPLTKTVPPGTYIVLLTLSGYEDYRETVTLQAGTPKTVPALLTKATVVPTIATLTVTSTPPGAQVSLNGTSSGTTPLTKTVPPGTYIVLLTLSGYEDYRETVTLQAGTPKTVPALLTKATVVPTTATLTVTSTPPGAQVSLNGTSSGTTPLTKTVPPGTYIVLLTLSGYEDYRETVTLQAGTPKTVPALLTKATVVPTTATLTVTSTPPGAQVSLNGTSSGTTPLTKTVPPGTYIVLLTLSGYEDYRETVTLQAGTPKTVPALLTKATVVPTTATLTVTSTPPGAQVSLNGTSSGTTPLTKTVPPGTYIVLLTLSGYEDYRETVTLQAGTPKTVPALLTKATVVPTTATLTVTSTPPGAQVSLNGTSSGTTPLTKTVPPGTYIVLLTLSGYEDYRETITLQAGTPKTVPALLTRIVQTSRWASIFAGQAHSLGLAADGSLWGWGSNDQQQLGDGTGSQRSAPVRIGTGVGWKVVAAGATHSLAIAGDGSLWAWGSNIYGQLGDGTTANRSTPARIGTRNDWIDVAAGEGHSLACARDGTLWAWGVNGEGQLGDGTRVDRSTPVRVSTRSDWDGVTAGGFHSLGHTRDGSLWAWGWNRSGQLGDGTNAMRPTPTRIGTGRTWTKLAAAGQEHSSAIADDGSLWAWGLNDHGQVGDGTTANRSTPVRVGTRTDWAYIAAGTWHSLAITRDGSLWVCGDNWNGQLGDSSAINRESPVQVGTGTVWTAVAGGEKHSLAIASDGSLWAWGDNERGQLGNGKTGGRYLSPVLVSSGP